jgi:hypothetical protein
MVASGTDARAFGKFSLSVKGVIQVLVKIFLHHAPKELNFIELAAELGKKDAQMTGGMDDFLDQ